MDYLEKRNKCKVEKNEQLLRWNLSLKNKLYYFICEHNACGAFFFSSSKLVYIQMTILGIIWIKKEETRWFVAFCLISWSRHN